jgi:hypothetical protein
MLRAACRSDLWVSGSAMLQATFPCVAVETGPAGGKGGDRIEQHPFARSLLDRLFLMSEGARQVDPVLAPSAGGAHVVPCRHDATALSQGGSSPPPPARR